MMQKNENPAVLSLVLLLISVVVALLLAFTNMITKDKIAENTLLEQNAAKQEVLSDATNFTEVENAEKPDMVKAVFEGKDGTGHVVGWCVNVAPFGYGGEVDLMVGILPDGTVSGMKVVSHSETAGLGAKASEPEFSDKFKGKSADGSVAVIKSGKPKENEIVALSGATITSKAVANGVNAAAEAVAALKGGA